VCFQVIPPGKVLTFVSISEAGKNRTPLEKQHSLEIINDLPIGFPINNIISLSLSGQCLSKSPSFSRQDEEMETCQ